MQESGERLSTGAFWPGRGATQRNELFKKKNTPLKIDLRIFSNPFQYELSAFVLTLPPPVKKVDFQKVTWKSLEWPKNTTETPVVWTQALFHGHISRCRWFEVLLPVPGIGTGCEGGWGVGAGGRKVMEGRSPAGFIRQLQRGSGGGMVSTGSTLGLDSKLEDEEAIQS